MGVGGEKGVSLEETATWAVAVVCFLLIAISILIEKLIHFIEKWLRKKRKTSLSKAHEQLKSEIMLLGFMSLLLSVLQEFIPDICIPENIATSFQPCSNKNYDENYQDPCQPKLKVQFISIHGIDQLHRFIFALAVTHVVCCATTLGLGRLKIKRWKSWEDETRTVEYQCYNDPERFRFARETTFGQRHLHFWSKSPLLLWIMCFFTQFFKSVAKVDYLTLRHGFIKEHLPSQSQSTFNFQKYISRSLEDDFRVVVGISPVIWLSAVLFLLTNTNGWYSHFWLPSIPLIIILLVGAKFQVIITQMGKSILERGAVVRGTPVVKLGDQLFWFRRPRLLLFFIHFVLFQNAFQIAFFAWSWYEFGYPSCYHENLAEIIIRIVTSLLVQVICSYVTLPLYALVTQMGSTVKPVIFSEQVASALRSWYLMASKRLKQRKQPEGSTTPTRGSTTPGHLLRDNRKPDEIKKGRVGRYNGGEISASPGQFDIDDTMRNNRYIGEIGSITPTRRGTSPGHLSLDKRKHDEKKKGKVGRDGGEEMSGSPGQYEIDDTLRNNRTTGEIESVAEYESNQAQQEIEISSRDFSFRNKQNELNFRVP